MACDGMAEIAAHGQTRRHDCAGRRPARRTGPSMRSLKAPGLHTRRSDAEALSLWTEAALRRVERALQETIR